MAVLKDFLCDACHTVFETVVERDESQVSCDCGGTAEVTFTKVAVVGLNEFNPHYDHQLGKHFQTADEKVAFLDRTGRSQIEGTLSPRKSTPARTLCTKTQAKAFDSRTDIKASELK